MSGQKRLYVLFRWAGAPAVQFFLSGIALNVFMMLPSLALPHEAVSLGALGSGSLLHRLWAALGLLRRQAFFWVSLEVVLWGSVFYLAGRCSGRWLRRAAVWSLGLLWAYEIYEVVIIRFFHRPPILANDGLLLADGFYFLVDVARSYWHWYLVGTGLLTAALGYLLPRLVRLFQESAGELRRRGSPRKAVPILAAAWMLVLAIYLPHLRLKDREGLVQSTLARMGVNVAASVELRTRLHRAESLPPDTVYASYRNLALGRKPDVFLFLVESYGKVLAETPETREVYRRRMDQLAAAMRQEGWLSATNYSVAPVHGGGSWLSMASVIGGVHIDSQPLWLKYAEAVRPNLATFFRDHGYFTVQLLPSSHARPGRPLQNTYGFDLVLGRDDLHYRGHRFGWGEVPDQYALGFAADSVLIAVRKPVFLLFMTVTPHAPWLDVPPLVADWRSLDTLQVGGQNAREKAYASLGILAKAAYGKKLYRFAPYLNAEFYDLEVILSFLRTRDPARTLALLVGDHQPTVLTRPEEGRETPIHVLSGNPELIREFRRHGFSEGLFKDPLTPGSIRHEAIFSLLAESLARCCGADPSDRWALYRPHGASLAILRTHWTTAEASGTGAPASAGAGSR